MSDTPIAAGTRLGHFELEEVIGEGAMAVVFRAVRSGAMSFRKTVALKVVRPEHVSDRTYIDALIDEARLGGFLNHGNIVQILDFEHIDDTFCMAMEYVDGVTLRQVLATSCREQISLGQALRIAIDVCRGLAHAQRTVDDRGQPLNLVHRDLKPSNIILSTQGQAKILDFGLARADTERLTNKTSTGVIKGTPLYMSPEQVLSQETDTRSDIFSLCTVLGEMVLGEKVFAGASVFEVITSIATGQTASALDKIRSLSPGLASVLERGWQVDKADRHADPDALRLELEGVLAQADGETIAALVEAHGAMMAVRDPGSSAVDVREISVVDTFFTRPGLREAAPAAGVGVRLSKKVCMLGFFGVGKTSLVARFVHSIFSEKYKTTVGVKIDKKVVTVDDSVLTMVLWDVHGDDRLRKVKASHLKGAAAYVLVVDGTRRESYDAALEMKKRLADDIHGLAFIVAVNKADLRDSWEVSDEDIEALRSQHMHVVLTSAKTGDGVEAMFDDLARMLVP